MSEPTPVDSAAPIVPSPASASVNKDDAAPKKRKFDSASTDSSKSSSVLTIFKRCLDPVSLVPVSDPEVSTFVPNASFMMSMVANVDNIFMSPMRKFIQHVPSWTPMHTRLYVSMIFYIQCMRCMKYAHIASREILQLLHNLDDRIGFKTIMVPGYLEPFFRSLTTTPCENQNFGLITPALPDLESTAEINQTIQLPFSAFLPPIPLLLRALRNMFRPGNPNTDREFDRNLVNDGQQAVPIGPDSPHRAARDARIMPGLKESIVLLPRTPHDVATRAPQIRFPLPNPEDDYDEWPDYLFLANDLKWFVSLCQMMSLYCRNFKNSLPLDSFSVTNGRMPTVEITFTHNYANEQIARQDEERDFFAAAIGQSRVLGLREDESSLALLSQINAIHPPNYVPGFDPHLQVLETRAGPFWNFQPIFSDSNPYDPSGPFIVCVEDLLQELNFKA